jgi:hypothetical protein
LSSEGALTMDDAKEELEQENLDNLIDGLEEFLFDLNNIRDVAMGLDLLIESLEEKIELKEKIKEITGDKEHSEVEDSLQAFRGFMWTLTKRIDSFDQNFIEKLKKATKVI